MGLLALAGMVSGAGKALSKAASQATDIYGSSMLHKERDKMEMRRLQLMEDNQNTREQRGYAHTEAMQAGQQVFLRDQQNAEFAHASSALDKTQGFTRDENDKTRQQHREDQLQAKAIADATLAQGDARLANDKEHQAATSRLAEAKLAAEANKEDLKPLGDGTFMRLNANGRPIGIAMDPNTGKPLQGPKDLPAMTKLMVDINKTMIQFKGEQLKNPSLLPDERNAINADIDRLKQNTERLLGMAPEKKGPVEIIDPSTKTTRRTPATGAEEYLAQMRQQADQRAAAMKSRTQQQAQAAMDADKPGMAAATTPLPEPPTQMPGAITAMERQIPRAMQAPGDVSVPTGMVAKLNPLKQFETDRPAKVPRELDRATPQPATPVAQSPEFVDPKQAELQARTTPGQPGATFPLTGQEPKGMLARVQEPPITDPNGPPVEPDPLDADGKQASADGTPASRPTGRALTPKQLTNLLTTEQKTAIADMRERVLKPGISERPATPGQLQDLVIKTYGPIFRENGQSPAELADFVEEMMKTLLPGRKIRG